MRKRPIWDPSRANRQSESGSGKKHPQVFFLSRGKIFYITCLFVVRSTKYSRLSAALSSGPYTSWWALACAQSVVAFFPHRLTQTPNYCLKLPSRKILCLPYIKKPGQTWQGHPVYFFICYLCRRRAPSSALRL